MPFKQIKGVFPIKSDGLDTTFSNRLEILLLVVVLLRTNAIGAMDFGSDDNNDDDLSNMIMNDG